MKGFRNIINVFNELTRKKKSKHEFSVMKIWSSGWQEAATYNFLWGACLRNDNENSHKGNYFRFIADY